MEEGKHTPTEEFEVYKKEDGSLGILFNYNDEWILATRGSFTSDQAIKGLEILQKYKYKYLPTDCTYLFEILYPENRIVVQHNVEELILLGVIQTNSGYEYDIHKEDYEQLGFPIVKKYDGIKDYSTLKSMIGDNEEGFVVKFSNGDRMKVKGEEYLRLHKIITNLSTTAIWDVLRNNQNMDMLLTDVPDEFYKKIKDFVEYLNNSKEQIISLTKEIFDNYIKNCDGLLPRKDEYAKWVKQQDKEIQPIFFRMFDGKDYEQYVWKLIKPNFSKI